MHAPPAKIHIAADLFTQLVHSGEGQRIARDAECADDLSAVLRAAGLDLQDHLGLVDVQARGQPLVRDSRTLAPRSARSPSSVARDPGRSGSRQRKAR